MCVYFLELCMCVRQKANEGWQFSELAIQNTQSVFLFIYAFILQYVSCKVQISMQSVTKEPSSRVNFGMTEKAKAQTPETLETLYVKAHTDDLTSKYRMGAPFM